jgi:hypothetical protein
MLRSLGALLLLAMMAGATARADTRQAQFVVQADVPARATLQIVTQPTYLSVSDEDVARGYKDVSALYVVSSNTSRGLLLRLSPRLGVTNHVEVRGPTGTYVVQDESVEIYRPRFGEPERLAFDYRFVLAHGARPGQYELPILVAATPL